MQRKIGISQNVQNIGILVHTEISVLLCFSKAFCKLDIEMICKASAAVWAELLWIFAVFVFNRITLRKTHLPAVQYFWIYFRFHFILFLIYSVSQNCVSLQLIKFSLCPPSLSAPSHPRFIHSFQSTISSCLC